MFNHRKLLELREELAISATDLMFFIDQHCGLRVSQQTLVNWEIGYTVPRAKFLPALAKFYGVQVEDFFDDKDN